MRARARTSKNEDGVTGAPRSVGIVIAVLALACLSVGLGLHYFRHSAVKTLHDARNWIATPCEITKNEWVSGDGDRSLVVSYTYRVGDETFTGDTLDAVPGRFGDDDEFEEMIHRAVPKGARTVCYVDPTDPSHAILDRDHGADAPRRMWLLAFPFTSVGLAFLVFGVSACLGGATQPSPGDPIAEATALLEQAPPRNIPLLTRLALLAGPSTDQIVWLFFVGFAYVFIIMDGPASYARLLNLSRPNATTIGHVTDVRDAAQEELFVGVNQFNVEYSVDGQTYATKGFLRGKPYDVGDEVRVEYDEENPAAGGLAGARATSMTWWHSAIPLGVLMLLGLGIVGMYGRNYRLQRLIRRGHIARARPRPLSYDESIRPSMTLSNFEFEADGKVFPAKLFSPRTVNSKGEVNPTDDESESPAPLVLYDAGRPKRNILVARSLMMLIGRNRSTADRLLDCAMPLIAIAVMIILVRGAGLV
ncbi:MAG TPA: DUF3592 domain-containing protein [Phycisphaerae bacterium]|nr:DUF3592 domain-containing protein [Phycisphaerae bacterium]